MLRDRIRLLARLLFTAGILFFAWQLLRAGIADFLRLGPQSYLESVKGDEWPDPEKLYSARDQLTRARAIDPRNPVVHATSTSMDDSQAILSQVKQLRLLMRLNKVLTK